MTDRKTVAGAYAKMDKHEEICALRYEQIHTSLTDMKADAKTQNRLVIGVLLALLGWMGVQLWDGQKHVEATATVVATTPQ